MPGCGCGKNGSDSKSGPFRVQAPNGGAITSWRTEAERDAAIARTGGKAI